MSDSIEIIAEDRDTYYMNMGPQHPSTHGVLRLVLHLDGETIIDVDPVIGYGHRAHEKMAENRDYLQFLPNTSRVDYLSGMIYNLAYCQAIEKMLAIEVPERAEYIRIIVGELNRISSHLLWLGTYLLDLGGITPFLYGFDDREKILDILDRITGSRLTYCYGRFGGVTMDVDDIFLQQTGEFIDYFAKRIDVFAELVIGNVIFQERTQGVGAFADELVQHYALSGPSLRAMGSGRDVRKDEPYGIYERFEFAVPTQQAGDCFARSLIRMEEMRQSLKIIRQALRDIPAGPIMAAKVPKRLRPPAGEYCFAVESARGRYQHYIVSDGSDVPFRHKLTTPSFVNISAMSKVMPGSMLSDAVAILGSIDIVVPEIDR